MIKSTLVIGCLLLGSVSSWASDKLSLADVTASPQVFTPGVNDAVKVSFNLNKPATVVLNIYDARDYLIRSIQSNTRLTKGEQSLSWNGKDQSSRIVPPEAYYYTLVATAENGESVTHDLTDKTGGDTVLSVTSKYDPAKKIIRYALPKTARVFIRVGIEGGNIYGTVVNGTIRRAGKQTQAWEGWDQSRVIALGKHPKLKVYVEGIQLSDNAIIVEDNKAVLPTYLPYKPNDIIKRNASAKPISANYHVNHVREQCHDFPITLSLPDNLKKDKDGLPIINGKTPLTMGLSDEYIAMLESQRFEVVYYLNNQLLYENEISYTPYNWIWDPKTLAGGVHYMTAVVIGYSGHYGVASIKFRLAKPDAKK